MNSTLGSVVPLAMFGYTPDIYAMVVPEQAHVSYLVDEP